MVDGQTVYQKGKDDFHSFYQTLLDCQMPEAAEKFKAWDFARRGACLTLAVGTWVWPVLTGTAVFAIDIPHERNKLEEALEERK